MLPKDEEELKAWVSMEFDKARAIKSVMELEKKKILARQDLLEFGAYA